MNTVPIDVWNIKTFDKEIIDELECEIDLVRNYWDTDKSNFLAREASDRTQSHLENPYAGIYLYFWEKIIIPIMQSRKIRAWHYSRLSNAEAAYFISDGIHTSDLAAIRRRLDAQVAAGTFPADIAAKLYTESPFHNEEYGSRSGKFWMVSAPLPTEYNGVKPLLESWGGESIHFKLLNNPYLKNLVGKVGHPRVIELAVPLDATNHSSSAAQAVMQTFARSIGCDVQPDMFDLYATRALGPEAVLKVHTEGEADFAALGCGYPAP